MIPRLEIASRIYCAEMDPKETYRLWTIAVLEENTEEAKEHFANLHDWLARGGFEPPQWWDPAASRNFFRFNPTTGRIE